MVRKKIQKQLYITIFGTNTKAGRAFDLILLWLIIISVVTVMLESIESVREEYTRVLVITEYVFTGIFTIEYILRILSHPKPRQYVFGSYGIIDLIAILPTYLMFFVPGAQYFISIRILRLLRVFRILKIMSFIENARILSRALASSFQKIMVFMMAVASLVIILGTSMYVIEGSENQFDSVPKSIYWTIVTITTVGYGDIVPQTPLGQFVASILMLMGYAIIAVPTGIVSVELNRTQKAVLQPIFVNLLH